MQDPDPAIGVGLQQRALLDFNQDAANHFRGQWRQVVQQRRLLMLGVGAAVLLGLVGTVFAYLKTDTATRGYYTGRLRLAAGLAIVGLIAAAAAVYMHG